MQESEPGPAREGTWDGDLAFSPGMISYAQNQEDVRLRRLFRADYVGFYIDIGANDPTFDSVTRYFYDRGWRGINVEPAYEFHAMQCAQRPRDVNLNVGISNRSGTAKFYEARGLSTFSEQQMAIHRAKGVEFVEREVAIQTLASVCEQNNAEEIDFLSIDVEGHERCVLEGADFERWRPLVVLIEATQPNTREPCHDAWEDLLLEARYRYAAFDGLNRYYIRAEDSERGRCLEVGPNVFDNFVPYRLHFELEEARRLTEKYRVKANKGFWHRVARLWRSPRGGDRG